MALASIALSGNVFIRLNEATKLEIRFRVASHSFISRRVLSRKLMALAVIFHHLVRECALPSNETTRVKMNERTSERANE